ncbi:predicted protein [Streptomyces iranensis]|uniref:Uncharacterized protein n=1 Tax=Streptomyces iranensis TaxID=576784 RepID=A0A060ZR04_9ACTN|nr:predicted protein [Streptomyces iranensis]
MRHGVLQLTGEFLGVGDALGQSDGTGRLSGE